MQGLIGSCKNTTKIYNFPLIFSLCYDIIFNCQSNFGWVPEWPKGADCKSVVVDFDGSNPSSSTSKENPCIPRLNSRKEL